MASHLRDTWRGIVSHRKDTDLHHCTFLLNWMESIHEVYTSFSYILFLSSYMVWCIRLRNINKQLSLKSPAPKWIPTINKWKSSYDVKYTCNPKNERCSMNSLQNNETWIIVENPMDWKMVTCKWVLGVKRDSLDKPIHYKARHIAQIFSQVLGIDFKDTFSPTLKIMLFCILVGLAATLNPRNER